MPHRLRPAEPADRALLLEYVAEFYAHEGAALDRAAAARAIDGLIADPSLGRIWLILVDDVPVGHVVVTFGYSLEFHGRDAFLDEIFIRADRRGQGIGRAVLAELDGICRDLGVNALHLEVERVNTRARALYRQAGYVDHDRYLMTKWLR